MRIVALALSMPAPLGTVITWSSKHDGGGLSKFAHGVVPPRAENDCGGLGGPFASRPLDLTTSGRVDGFTCQSKTPFEPTCRVLSRLSVNVEPSNVGVSKVF